MGSLFKTPKPPKAPDPIPPVKETGADLASKRKQLMQDERRRRGMASTKSQSGGLMGGGYGSSGSLG